MREALRAAEAAGRADEVPVGAVVVSGDRLLAAAGNLSIADHDPTGHAEVRALRIAARTVGNYRLPGAVLYATVEPCVMCMGAAIHARIARVVFGCADTKGGAATSLYRLGDDPRLNHRIAVAGGVEGDECRRILQVFFRARRVA